MPRQHRESGAALIMLIGMTAALAILTAALVMLLANQQGATAASRQSKTSLDYAEAALDSGINSIKITTQGGSNFPTVSPGVDMSSMNVQYAVACPAPAAPPATYNVYDNANPVVTSTHWDANLDHKLWIEATVSFKGHTSRLRQMLDSSTKSSVLPMAAMYADTTVVLNDTSNAYAVQPDGTFVPATSQYVYNIMAGGSYTNNTNRVVTGNNGTTLRPPSGTAQSLGLKVNGTVSLPGVAENGVVTGGVGLLSDYFDQARQYALTVEAQSGMGTAGLAMHNDTAAPSAPTPSPTATAASTKFTPTNITTISGVTSTGTTIKTYTIPDLKVTGNLALASGGSAFPAGTTFNFSKLWVDNGTFTVTGDVDVNVTTLYVKGALTISGDTTANTDSLGTAYVTGATAISGATGLTLNSTNTSYFGSTFSHTPSAAVTDNLGPLYITGNATFSSASGNLSIAGGKNVHAGGTFTITGPSSSASTVPCVFGSLFSVGSISITKNAVMDTTDLYTGGGFSLQGNTASFTDQFGPVYVTGIADWNCGSTSARLRIETTSATASLPTTGTDPTSPAPMYAQIFTIDGDTDGDYDTSSGPYDVVLGDVWVDGNAGTGDVAVNFSAPSSGTASTIMCPLLATTEKTCTNGYINMGTLQDPMVYYMDCDNDGLYSNTCEWASTGTFTGIAIIMESDIEVTGGNNGSSWQTANFIGSLMAGCPVTPDITMSGTSSVCYNQKVVENLPANLQSILRTTTTTTVPGTWQQLSAH